MTASRTASPTRTAVRWKALWRRDMGGLADTAHAVPEGSNTALCGSEATEVSGRRWVDLPAPNMRKHKDCVRRVHALPGKGKCPTGKVRFRTEHDALIVLAEAKMRAALHNSKRRREERHYLCPHCSGWHLTSTPLGVAP